MAWKQRGVIAGGLVFAACAFLALGWFLGSNESAQTAASAASRTGPTASGSAPAAPVGPGTLMASPVPSRPPMPLPGVLPATELAAILWPRAKAGDPVAACRLALELAECRTTRRWRLGDRETQIRQLGHTSGASLEQLKQVEAQLAWFDWQTQRKDDCAALPKQIRDLGPQLMLQSALQGNVRAKVGFASLRGVGGEEMVASPMLYAQYRQNAFPLWRQAFESGSVDALQAWLSALNSNGFEFFAGTLPDEFRDRALAQAMMLEVYRELRIDPAKTEVAPRIDATVDPDTARRARVLFDRHFRNSPGLAAARERFAEVERRHIAQIKSPPTPAENWAHTAAGFDEACRGP